MIPARFPNGVEVRAAVELRATSGRRLGGYAAVFNVEARIGDFREMVRPGAFRKSLLNPARDVLALMDHSTDRVLARTANGSLRLSEDARGLAFDLDLPPTTLGNDALAMAEAHLLGGCSFGFRVLEEAWPTRDQRELRAVELIEISLISAHPAYAATSVAARGRLVAGGAARARLSRLLEVL
jgi:HK97 family phage prohead protease